MILLALALIGLPFTVPDQCSYSANLTGSVARQCSAKFQDVVAVEDFGAACNGTADDATALKNASAAAVSLGKTLVVDCKVRVASAAGSLGAALKFEGAGALDVSAAGGSVTVAGPVTAPLGQIFFTGSGTLTFSAKVAAVYPQWWGAKGDGATNDTTAINNAITSLGASGGQVYFPPGTYMAATITLPSNVWLFGSGTNATTLKMPNGANADVVQGANFLTLTNTVYQSPENRGANFTRISDMTIDGNKANNATGYCIRVWGHSMRWSNIAFQNGPSGNIWTEYAGGDGWSLHTSDPKQGDPESSFEHIKSNTAGGDGWTYRGPHDSSISDFVSSGNNGWALNATSSANHYSAAGIIGFQWNAYGDNDGFSFGPNSSPLAIAWLTASSVNRGFFTDATNGSSNLTHFLVAGCLTYGVTLQGQHNFFQGEISRNHTSAGTGGDGLIIANLLDSYVFVHGDTNFNAVKFTSESNGNYIWGWFNVPATISPGAVPGTLYTGTPHVNSYVNLMQYGNATTPFFQLPAGASFNIQAGKIANTNGNNFFQADDQATGMRVTTPDSITLTAGLRTNVVRALVTTRVAPTYGASVPINASNGNEYVITATNGTAFTVANPTNAATGQRVTIRIRNTFGVLGALTFDTLYKAAAWTQPANGFSRAIDFQYDGTNWIEVSRTPSDVPN